LQILQKITQPVTPANYNFELNHI